MQMGTSWDIPRDDEEREVWNAVVLSRDRQAFSIRTHLNGMGKLQIYPVFGREINAKTDNKFRIGLSPRN